MRLMAFFLFLGLPLAAQDGPPVRILRGELTQWKVDRSGVGEFSVRGADSEVEWCQVDSSTYMTRQTLRLTAIGVKEGDNVEVVADTRKGTPRCLAMTIYVLAPNVARRMSRQPPLSLPAPPRGFLDNLFARGNMTFAGLVQSLEPNRLVLKTRDRGNQTFHVRPDTIFSAGGKVVDSDQLKTQTSVFVRAGRGYGGELEVYQVIWGDIVNPR